MIKEINFLPNEIVIEEEKKGFFGIKKKTININIQSIKQIEKCVQDEVITSINIKYKEYEMYFIENVNYNGDLNVIYEKILNYREGNLFEVVETDLTNGEPTITILFEGNLPNN